MKYIQRPLYLVALLVVVTLVACNRYLEVSPDSSHGIEIDSEDKIAELLTGAYPSASYFAFLEPRTDNVSVRANGQHTRLSEAMYLWEDYDQENLDTPLNYWNACYAGIAQVNKALELLASYPKTPRVKALYGEAFVLRAYLHFMLVNIWSEPYRGDGSKQDLGIPYLTKPEKHALVDYDRGTVADVYDQIERDLKLGITLVDDRYYKHPVYHFNKRAAYAFASRFYLTKGDWPLVVQYADYILGADPRRHLRHWMQYRQSINGSSSPLYLRYNDKLEPANLLLSTTESRLARTLPTDRYGSTHKLISSIFNAKGIEGCSDYSRLNLEFIYPFSYGQGAAEDAEYLAKFDEVSLGQTGLRPRGLYVTNVLFSSDEVMLNRIEAYAMLRQYDKAIGDLRLYMQGKFGIVPSCSSEVYTSTSEEGYQVYTPFYGLNIRQLALVKLILDFRQKEFFHEGLRWFDLRRFHMTVKHGSQILGKNDMRKTLQIPIEAIRRGLKPNPRMEDAQQPAR